MCERAGALGAAPALFVTIPLGGRLEGRKGSQEPGIVPWQETAFKLFVFELVSVGIPLLVLRLINKLLARSA